MALSADRKIDWRLSPRRIGFAYPVAAGYRVFRNSLVTILQNGTLVPAGTASPPSPAVRVEGLAEHMQDNTATGTMLPPEIAGPAPVLCNKGSFALPFDVAPTAAALGAPVYAIDDQTVSLSSNSGARLQAGVLDGFDTNGTPYVLIS